MDARDAWPHLHKRRMPTTRLRLLLGVVLLSACDGAPEPPPFDPVANVKQLMVSVLEPAAEVYWDAVGSVTDAKGTVEFSPKTAAEWDAVRNSAFVIAESGNLLMMAPRAMDATDWMSLSRAMIEAGARAIKAAEARDPVAVFDVGAQVYDSCTNCHATYALGTLRPNARQE